ncbi:MAG: hypothetical protein HYZ53_23455 [Planctomycetes bacterium]|nr:hypothetical protein [Planctomycetota bacterium]
MSTEGLTRTLPRLLVALLVLQGGWMAWAWSDYQTVLAPDDHGWNLYAFWRVAEGEMPYRDFAWSYGPVMPYFYALGFKLAGVRIPTVLALHGGVLALGSLLLYFVARRVAGPGLSFLAGAVVPSIGLVVHSYNHAGIVPLLLGALLAFLRSLEDPRRRVRWLALAAGLEVLAAGVLASMAAASMAALCLSALLVELYSNSIPGAGSAARLRRGVQVSVGLGLAWLAGTVLLYYAVLRGVPGPHLRHCFGIHGGEIPYMGNPLWSMAHVWAGLWRLATDPAHAPTWWWVVNRERVMAGLLPIAALGGGLVTLRLCLRRRVADPRGLAVLTLFLVTAFTSHQFLWTGGAYTLLWGPACGILPLTAWLFEAGLARCLPSDERGKKLRLLGTLLFAAACALATGLFRQIVPSSPQDRSLYLPLERARVHGGNRELDKVLEDVTRYLEAETAPGEAVAVFPYAPLYLYLAARPSAVYHLQTLLPGDLTDEDERSIIAAIEARHVRVVLFTNKVTALPERFGEDFGLAITSYLAERFAPVAQFGDGPWRPASDWVEGHQVLVLRRRE